MVESIVGCNYKNVESSCAQNSLSKYENEMKNSGTSKFCIIPILEVFSGMGMGKIREKLVPAGHYVAYNFIIIQYELQNNILSFHFGKIL